MLKTEQTESERIETLRGYGILDTPNEPEFDAIVKEAAQACRTPIALISFVDESRQWFKAKVGLEPSETPRSISFCTHAIHGDQVMVVEDARRDPRVVNSPLVTGNPNIRFYAGAPLRTRTGARLGTLCVIDDQPRTANPRQVMQLEELAQRVVVLLEQRRERRLRQAAGDGGQV